ncbi:MAG: hypothetical protein WBA89_06460 [Microcoleus sp.]|uniref:hypothetical protein n=1 Tax=Microcoleus sp. TaxID=44472 RepID=UPI003C70635A
MLNNRVLRSNRRSKIYAISPAIDHFATCVARSKLSIFFEGLLMYPHPTATAARLLRSQFSRPQRMLFVKYIYVEFKI